MKLMTTHIVISQSQRGQLYILDTNGTADFDLIQVVA